jgi:DNA-directed RNA polymerase specialized sigma24 family protein
LRPVFNADWKARAMGGNAEAIGVLAEAALPPLYNFCLYRVGRDRHLCEEVVQETLVRAIRDLSHYDPNRAGDNIFPWLTGLARNEISRVLSRHKSAVSLEAMWARASRVRTQVVGVPGVNASTSRHI